MALGKKIFLNVLFGTWKGGKSVPLEVWRLSPDFFFHVTVCLRQLSGWRIDMNIFQAMDSRRYWSVCRPVKSRASSYDLSPKIIRKAQTCWDSSWLVSFFVRLECHTGHTYSKTGRMTVVLKQTKSPVFGHALLVTLRKCNLEADFAHMKSMWASHFMLEEMCMPNSLKEVTLSTAWLSTTSWGGGSFCSGPRTISFVFLQFNFTFFSLCPFYQLFNNLIHPDWLAPSQDLGQCCVVNEFVCETLQL